MQTDVIDCVEKSSTWEMKNTAKIGLWQASSNAYKSHLDGGGERWCLPIKERSVGGRSLVEASKSDCYYRAYVYVFKTLRRSIPFEKYGRYLQLQFWGVRQHSMTHTFAFLNSKFKSHLEIKLLESIIQSFSTKSQAIVCQQERNQQYNDCFITSFSTRQSLMTATVIQIHGAPFLSSAFNLHQTLILYVSASMRPLLSLFHLPSSDVCLFLCALQFPHLYFSQLRHSRPPQS